MEVVPRGLQRATTLRLFGRGYLLSGARRASHLRAFPRCVCPQVAAEPDLARAEAASAAHGVMPQRLKSGKAGLTQPWKHIFVFFIRSIERKKRKKKKNSKHWRNLFCKVHAMMRRKESDHKERNPKRAMDAFSFYSGSCK